MAKEKTFTVGDAVVLLSGGPVMTVTAPRNTYGSVHCDWFAGAANKSAQFPAGSLRPATPEETKKGKAILDP